MGAWEGRRSAGRGDGSVWRASSRGLAARFGRHRAPIVTKAFDRRPSVPSTSGPITFPA